MSVLNDIISDGLLIGLHYIESSGFFPPFVLKCATFSCLPRFSDATMYAHFLFNAFDMDRSGAIRFEASSPAIKSTFIYNVKDVYELNKLLSQDFVLGLSVLLRGSVTEKLRWAFNLYDINKDGYITKEVDETSIPV